ncbi:MAG: TetR/AcrR family transcriptional regulator [Erysipelotrichaceae bacterium]|nr:TetR/AcrR family transcriptional regulator [Erysipelotrichaceae bacterium]
MTNKIKESSRFNYKSNFGENNPLLTNTKLFDLALDEFVTNDFQHASLNDILKKADIAKSSFYYQYGDKLGLYLAMMDVIIQKKLKFFNERMNNVDLKADFFTVIRQLSKETMDFMFMDKRLYHFSNQMMYQDKELLAVVIKYFPYDVNASFKPLLERAFKEKLINQKYPIELVGRVLQVLLSNIDKLLDEHATAEKAYQTLNLVFDVLEKGIKE